MTVYEAVAAKLRKSKGGFKDRNVQICPFKPQSLI